MLSNSRNISMRFHQLMSGTLALLFLLFGVRRNHAHLIGVKTN